MRDLVRRSRCGRFVERLQPSRLYFSSFHVGSHPLQLIIDSSGFDVMKFWTVRGNLCGRLANGDRFIVCGALAKVGCVLPRALG